MYVCILLHNNTYSEILKYIRSYFVIFTKNMKYAMVFVLSDKSKYAFMLSSALCGNTLILG